MRPAYVPQHHAHNGLLRSRRRVNAVRLAVADGVISVNRPLNTVSRYDGVLVRLAVVQARDSGGAVDRLENARHTRIGLCTIAVSLDPIRWECRSE
eukprot:CAMPEP_0119317638 /NCGR_PEP_ID=MMETSP1333-20130426/43774_1 /TAXON_ID=418940 /ORGANISM="Scyphosphaera apsteinii, Strain RCC1455" /LENGTH=95 /DNA_ID=CAMNT_0007323625 /DNA_START=234 /DNA_END=521 /DNA_ORIENTATION=+